MSITWRRPQTAPERALEDRIFALLQDLPGVESIERQFRSGRSRMDLVAHMRDGRVWVIMAQEYAEVKAWRVQRGHVAQMERYLSLARSLWPGRAVRGALVAPALGVGLPERPDMIYRALL